SPCPFTSHLFPFSLHDALPILFLALVIFLLSGVIISEQALKGFSNEGMLTVLLLFIVAGAIQKHGIIEMIVYRLLGKAKDARKSMIKVTLPIGFASGFLNNKIGRASCRERG